MALSKPDYYDISKYNDNLIVDFAKKHKRKAYLYHGNNDMKDKMDIALQFKDGKMCNIDTKYINRKESNLYYEFKKHAENSSSKTDWLLYCLRKTGYKKCWFVRRSALNKITNDGRPSYIINKDPLKDFNINEINENDKILVDFSKLGMK